MLPKKGGKPNWPKLALDWLRTPRFNPLDLTNDSKSVLAFNLSYLFDRTDLLKRFVSDLRQWIEEGKIQAPPVKEYAFEDVTETCNGEGTGFGPCEDEVVPGMEIPTPPGGTPVDEDCDGMTDET